MRYIYKIGKNIYVYERLTCDFAQVVTIPTYCYEIGNSVVSFNIKTINKCLINKYIELVSSKAMTSVEEREIYNKTVT